jgi:rhamnogalacturonyl hydrolase YesR
MKLSTIARVFPDFLAGQNLKELYWDFSKTVHGYKQLLNAENRVFATAFLEDQRNFLLDTVKPISGENEQRIKAACEWLIRGKMSSDDNGVSLGYFPCQTTYGSPWFPSYPETTGYIIQSLVEYSQKYDDPTMLEHALSMATWESEVQMSSGAVQGGPLCEPEKQTAAIFNTGMVLQGYTAAIRAGADEDILKAAYRAADFLVNDLGSDGHCQTHGKFVTNEKIKTYNCLCSWALFRFSEDTGKSLYKNAAIRMVEAALGEQKSNGWFANNCLTTPLAPLTHTIGYTLQGILEVGLLSGREDFVSAVVKGVNPVMEKIKPNGFLHGRFYSNWEPACFSSCLTGSAQIAIVCFRLFEKTGDRKYKDSADKMVNYLKPLQKLDSPNDAMNGAIAGSFPISGSYMTMGYPNWATKFFLDSLVLQSKFSDVK